MITLNPTQAMAHWNERFLESTRGRVVVLLRRGDATVNELATALELTDNAVRAHLATLERDGLVRQNGQRSAVRKPETLYGLTSQAAGLFPQAYAMLLDLMLEALERQLEPAAMEALLREVGRSIATRNGIPTGSPKPGTKRELRRRAEIAVKALGQLGGLAELQQVDGSLRICGFSCPIASVVETHPYACAMAEALLEEITGAKVTELCDRSGRPQCRFQLG